MGAVGVALLLAGTAWGVGAATRFLGRPIRGAVLGGFLLLSVLPYPRAFVTDATPLPLDHAQFLVPWYSAGDAAPFNPYLNDIATQILPWAKAARLAWKEGSLPWRDRWNGCGTPLAANSVSAVFFPITLATLLFSLARGITLAIAVKLFLASAGMWLWTRELRVSAHAAGFAAVAFALSFTFVPPWILYPQSGVFCLWPWMLFLVERCRDERGRARGVAALAAVFALIVLAGHPESAAIGALFAALFLVGRWAAGDLPDFPRLARSIAAAAAAALGLTAFLLVPSILAIGASARLAAAAQPYWQPLLSLRPHAPQWTGILTAFFPHTLGNGIQSPTVPGGTGTFCEMAMGYAGVLTWLSALLVLRRGSARPRGEAVLWGIALIGFGQAVCLWPLAEIFARVPAFRYVFPLRFNAWVALALPVIAAFELDRYARDLRERRRGPAAILVAAAVLGASGLGLYAYLWKLRRTGGGLRFQTLQLAMILLVLAAAALLAWTVRARPEVFVASLTLLCGVELLYQWSGLNRLYSPALLFPETPLLHFLHGQTGAFRVAGRGPVLFPGTNVFALLEDVRTHDAVERRDYMEFLDRTCGYLYADYFKKLGNLDAPALDFLNVRYVLDAPGASAPGVRWRPVYSGTDGTVFENARVLPRAFSPERIRRVPPPPSRPWPVLDAAKAFGPAFPQLTATDDWRATAWLLDEGEPEAANGAVEISNYAERTNSASFEARVGSGAPAFVVLSLIQDGGWSARDDRGEIPTLLANGPFLALRVAPGSHRIRLLYRPPGLLLGASVSAATLALLAAAAVVSRRARKR